MDPSTARPFLATQVLPLRRLCCPSLSSLGCMEHPRSELIAQTGWCCNQAAKQHLLNPRLYSKVLLDVQRCCCPPKTAIAPAPVHLCRSFSSVQPLSARLHMRIPPGQPSHLVLVACSHSVITQSTFVFHCTVQPVHSKTVHRTSNTSSLLSGVSHGQQQRDPPTLGQQAKDTSLGCNRGYKRSNTPRHSCHWLH